MNSNSGPVVRFEESPAEEKQPLIEDPDQSSHVSGSNEPHKNTIEEPEREEKLPFISVYSLKSSQKIQSTAQRGFLTFLKGLIGTGILALPYIIQEVGLIPAWILLAVIGCLNFRTMQLINEVANDLKIVKVDFGRLSGKVTGREWVRYLTEINIHIMQLGGALPGLIFTFQYLEKISCFYEWEALCGVKSMQLLVILALVLPIGAITDLHYLSIPSGIALIFQIAFYATFLIICGQRIHQYGLETGSFTAYNLHYLPIAFASILYAYEGIGLLLEIRASVANSREFNKVLTYAFFASTLLYCLFGTMGKLAFGSNVESVIFLNLNQDNTFIVLLEFGYLFSLIIAIPASAFPPIRIMESWKIFRVWIMDVETGKKSKWKRQLIRQPVFLMLVLIAAIAPSFNVVISLIGGLNFTILCFILPVILYNIRFKDDPTKQWHRIFNWLILIVGAILGSIATVDSFAEIFGSSTETTR